MAIYIVRSLTGQSAHRSGAYFLPDRWVAIDSADFEDGAAAILADARLECEEVANTADANLRVARDVLDPRIIPVPVHLLDDAFGLNNLVPFPGTPVAADTGKIGGGALLTGFTVESGTNSHLVNSNSTVGGLGGSFTLECWFKPVTFPASDAVGGSGGTVLLLGKDNDHEEWGVAISISPDLADGVMSFEISGSDDSYPNVSVTLTADPWVIGTWYQCLAWFDSVAKTLNIQINDGVVHSADSVIGTNTTETGAEVSVDCQSEGNSTIVDMHRHWNRVLTSDERAALYNSGAGLALAAMDAGLKVDLDAAWEFEGSL